MNRKRPDSGRAARSAAAESAATDDAEHCVLEAATGCVGQDPSGEGGVRAVWLSQKMMATLYDVTVPAINQHLKRIFADRELVEDAVIKQLLTTAADGKTYNVKHYSLQASRRRRAERPHGQDVWRRVFNESPQAANEEGAQ